jgi:uncharacterized protein YaeQ
MALKASIHKVRLRVADMDRHYYAEHVLTVARHPSETDERMMLRVLAFACHADAALAFGRGVSTADEPDLWLHDSSGGIRAWIQLGQPDERAIRRACGRAGRVFLYTYGGQAAEVWWTQSRARLANIGNLTVIDVAPASSRALATLAAKSLQLDVTLQDGQAWVADGERAIEVKMQVRQSAVQ